MKLTFYCSCEEPHPGGDGMCLTCGHEVLEPIDLDVLMEMFRGESKLGEGPCPVCGLHHPWRKV